MDWNRVGGVAIGVAVAVGAILGFCAYNSTGKDDTVDKSVDQVGDTTAGTDTDSNPNR